MNGWIRLHRSLVGSKLWSCSDATLRVAIYLLLTANHEPRWVRRIEIRRGQTVRSLTQIAADCGISRKAARYALKVLIADDFILVDAPFGAQQGHRITVCNFDLYQGDDTPRGTVGAQEGTHEGTHEGTTNKKEKNVRRRRSMAPGSIGFDFETRKFTGIEDRDIQDWRDAYPATDPIAELKQMREWLLANPDKRKTAYRRFITNWLRRTQDRGGTTRSEPASTTGYKSLLPEGD